MSIQRRRYHVEKRRKDSDDDAILFICWYYLCNEHIKSLFEKRRERKTKRKLCRQRRERYVRWYTQTTMRRERAYARAVRAMPVERRRFERYYQTRHVCSVLCKTPVIEMKRYRSSFTIYILWRWVCLLPCYMSIKKSDVCELKCVRYKRAEKSEWVQAARHNMSLGMHTEVEMMRRRGDAEDTREEDGTGKRQDDEEMRMNERMCRNEMAGREARGAGKKGWHMLDEAHTRGRQKRLHKESVAHAWDANRDESRDDRHCLPVLPCPWS